MRIPRTLALLALATASLVGCRSTGTDQMVTESHLPRDIVNATTLGSKRFDHFTFHNVSGMPVNNVIIEGWTFQSPAGPPIPNWSPLNSVADRDTAGFLPILTGELRVRSLRCTVFYGTEPPAICEIRVSDPAKYFESAVFVFGTSTDGGRHVVGSAVRSDGLVEVN